MHEEAQKTRRQGESPDQAFARFYSAPENLELRKAIQIVKSVPMMDTTPVQVGGSEALDVNNDSAKAMTQLRDLADAQRLRVPTLIPEQAFARVFEAPENAELAAKAHRRPTPTTSYPMPR